jgi:hypothetical protein
VFVEYKKNPSLYLFFFDAIFSSEILFISFLSSLLLFLFDISDSIAFSSSEIFNSISLSFSILIHYYY